MIDEVIARVLESARDRDVDRSLLGRLAAEEAPRARSVDDAAKRVKRRLHQAVGAYRGRPAATAADELLATWSGRWDEPMREACRRALGRHASTRERAAEIDRFHAAIWTAAGATPRRLLDVACGLNPLALPFMGLDATAEYLACDADRRVLDEVESCRQLVGQPHRTWACDLVTGAPAEPADVALVLKTIPLLDRQDAAAAARLLAGLRAPRIVVSFPSRSLGGRGGLDRAYRRRMATLVDELDGRVAASTELRFDSELVFVLAMEDGGG